MSVVGLRQTVSGGCQDHTLASRVRYHLVDVGLEIDSRGDPRVVIAEDPTHVDVDIERSVEVDGHRPDIGGATPRCVPAIPSGGVREEL